MGLVRGVGCVENRVGFVEVIEVFFIVVFIRDVFRFWSDFGRFWKAKMEAKIDFWKVFRDVFFDRVLESIFL